MTIVKAASTTNTSCQSTTPRAGTKPSTKSLKTRARVAAFEPIDNQAVTGKGAPS